MSGAYFIFPLRLVVVFNLNTTSSRNGLEFYSVILLRLRQVINLDTCLIRNALAIRPLAAGIAAVDRIRPLGGEGFSATFANPILPFFQPPLFQILLITPVPAQTVIAIFFGADLRIKDPPAALTDDFPHRRVRPWPGEFFLIPLLQRFLIFVFPITVPHEITPPFMERGRSKYLTRPIPCLYGFCFLLLRPLLPIPHFAVRFPLASLTAVFHIVSGRGECFPAVFANTVPFSSFRHLLPVEFCPAVRAAEQSI